MVMPIANDIRVRAITLLAAGQTVRQAAASIGISHASVGRWSQAMRATGSIAPRKMGCRTPLKIGGDHEIWLRARMAQGPFTLRGQAAELAEQGLRAHHSTMLNFVKAERRKSQGTAPDRA